MPQLPYNCSIDALVPLALFDKEQKVIREKEEQQHQEEFRRKRVLSLDNILTDICTVFEIEVDMVKSKARAGELVLCRKIFCFLTRKKTGFTCNQIGQFLGGRDHTTILHHSSVVEGFLKVKEPRFIETWERFLENSSLFNENDFKK